MTGEGSPERDASAGRRVRVRVAAVAAAAGAVWLWIAHSSVDARPAATAVTQPPPVTARPAAPVPVPAPGLEPPSATPGAGPPAATEPPAAVAPPPRPAPQAQPPMGPPSDPRLAQVYAVFESHCAQCHQTGRLTRPAPAGGLANILDLNQIAREPHLVARGQPDSSRLYQTLLDRHRPVDLGPESKWLAADDIQRVRTWIEELPKERAACVSGPRTSEPELAAAIDEALRAAGESEAQEMRFVSLNHLAAACATAGEMEAYRQGVAKLLNSLSWGSRPVALTPVGEARTLLAFKLSDIGWIDEHWNALARAEPPGIALDLSGRLTAPGANSRPIRGDWLAWTASQPGFYAELLGLPSTLEETALLLGIKREPEPGGPRAMRTGLKVSAVTRGPRVIERHQAEQRRLWLAYEFIDGLGDRDIHERPLGGIRGAPERAQFRADGERLIFTLPNGFLGFGVLDADGRRIDQLPQRLEVDAARSLGPTVAGLSCMGCHTTGVKPAIDTVRAHVASDKFSGSRDVKDMVLAVYDTANEWARVFDEDAYRYRRALIQAGVDPDLSVHGLELVAALARRYVLDADLAVAAAEAGLTPDEFDRKLAAAEFPDRTLVMRLRQAMLPRAEINSLLAAVRAAPPKGGDGGLAGAAPRLAQGLKLALWTDRPTYKAGELMTIHARPTAPCHLTVISVDAAGKATVLFPSEFEPDNLVTPEAPLTLPAEKAPYQFRFKDRGAETIIATCQTVARFPAGIEPDYERQRFTVLGSYENFIRTSYGLDWEPQRPAAPRPERLRVPRGQVKAEPPKPEPKVEPAVARAAIRIAIE